MGKSKPAVELNYLGRGMQVSWDELSALKALATIFKTDAYPTTTRWVEVRKPCKSLLQRAHRLMKKIEVMEAQRDAYRLFRYRAIRACGKILKMIREQGSRTAAEKINERRKK